MRTGPAGDHETVAADGLFVLIGARPHTDWLPGDIARDERGFVLTGDDAASDGAWPLERRPFSLETTMPGVFAAGDVRQGSVKRVASAVGEGSIAIQLVHGLLASDPIDSGHPKVEAVPATEDGAPSARVPLAHGAPRGNGDRDLRRS